MFPPILSARSGVWLAALSVPIAAFGQIAGFTAAAISTQQVVLVWNPAPSVPGLALERSADGLTGWATLASLGPGAVSWQDATVTPGETFHYRLSPSGGSGATTTTVAVPPRDGLAGGLLSTSALDLWRAGDIFAVASQSDGKWIVAGRFTRTNGIARENLARLNADGSLDTTFAPTALPNGDVRCVAIQPDGKVVLGGTFTQVGAVSAPLVARLLADGAIDPTFNSALPASGTVRAVVLLADGRMFVGGRLGNSGTNSLVARLNPNGSRDTSFAPRFDGTFPQGPVTVKALALQGDGKILATGDFTTVRNPTGTVVVTTDVVRLNTNGTIDTTFAAVDLVYSGPIVSSGSALAVQPDGKVLVGGLFYAVGIHSYNRLARLNSDGSVDTSFSIGTGASLEVLAIQLLSLGRIAIGGHFYQFGNQTVRGFAIVNGAGTPASSASVFPTPVQSIALSPSGKIALGGSFHQVAGERHQGIVVLLSGGTLPDPSFSGSLSQPAIATALAAQPDGQTVVTGDFTSIGGPDALGSPRYNLLRLGTDGSLDPNFGVVPQLNFAPSCAAVGGDGKVWVGGYFDTFFGPMAHYLARFRPDGTLDTPQPISPNNVVRAIQPEAAGGAAVGGDFTYLGLPRDRIARLQGDGSIATDFSGAGANNIVWEVVRQADGKLLVGGGFTSFLSQPRSFLARVHADGSLDTGFSPAPDSSVGRIIVDSAARIWVSGGFSTIGGASRSGLARLLGTGAADPGFVPAESGAGLLALDNGRCIAGGTFSNRVPGRTLRVIRLEADGSFDPSFDAGTPPDVTPSAAVVASQGVLLGGSFSTFGGQPRYGLVRVRTSDALSPPAAPGPLVLTATSATSASLGWSLVSGSTGYLVERSAPGSAAWQIVALRTAGEAAYVNAALPPGTSWRYRVSAFNAAGLSATTNTVTAALPSTFAQWRLDWAINPALAPDADPDGDDLALLAEYAVGLSPVSPDAGAATLVETGDGLLRLTYFRARTDVAYSVEASVDLVAWSTAGVDQGEADPWVTASIPISPRGALFLRLRCTLLPDD